MHHRWIIGWLVWLSVLSSGGTIATAADSQQVERHKGLTVDDLTRGLRSAAQNIEKEIPKIGSAIGKTITSITGNSSEKKRTQESTADKK